MAEKKPVRVTNPNGVTSWVSAEQAERLLTLPGWKRAEPAKKPARKGR